MNDNESISINKRQFIFSSGDICKICNCRVWYFSEQWYTKNNKWYITCPSCNNEIRIK